MRQIARKVLYGMGLIKKDEPTLTGDVGPKKKKIFQDEWFDAWFTRKDGLLQGRFIEYAWVLRHINLEEGSILDSGCGASFFPLMMALQGYKVVATDFNNYDYGFKYYEFIQGDSATVDLDERIFDRITLISSLEHYGVQHVIDDYKDVAAIENLGKYLKPNGLWLVTLPFGREKLLPSWRVYDQKRIDLLFSRVIRQEHFVRDNGFWLKTTSEAVEDVEYIGGKWPSTVTCLVAKK